MLNKLLAIITPLEALALTGTGLFVFGIWQIYQPAALIVGGLLLMIPFINEMRGK